METKIGYDAVKQQIFVDRSLAGDEKIRKENIRKTIDLQNPTGTIRMEILVDKSSLEVFFNGVIKNMGPFIRKNK